MNDLLQADSSYITATGRNIPLFARTVPTLYFYSRFFGVICRASRLAKRGQYDGKTWSASSLEILHLLEDIGVSMHITGLEEFRKVAGPCVVIGNHMSMMETVVLPVMIQPLKPVTFVIKESLLKYPIFKHIMRSRDPVAVSRTNPRQDLKTVLEEGEKRLQQGISIIVFPQTTRTDSFDPSQMSSIGVKLAKRAGVPIIPLALKTDAWKNGKYIKDFGVIDASEPVRFAFGEPLSVVGKGAEEQQMVAEFISGKLAGWGRAD
jgi:1-acyl-sn-glycerol-3-phosphate acyltransferase